MNTGPVMVMTAGREAEQVITKSFTKIDKSGIDKKLDHKDTYEINQKTKSNQIYGNKNPYDPIDYSSENNLMKMNIAEYSPKTDKRNYQDVYKTYANQSSTVREFVTAVDDVDDSAL